MTDYNYQLQQQPITMEQILRNRLNDELGIKLIKIMDTFNDKPLNIKDFASQLTDTVLEVLGKLENDLQAIENPVIDG